MTMPLLSTVIPAMLMMHGTAWMDVNWMVPESLLSLLEGDLVDRVVAQGTMEGEGRLLVQDGALIAVLTDTGPEIARLVTGKTSAIAVGRGAILKETARTAPKI